MPPKFLIAKQVLNMDLEVLFVESTTDLTELILLTNKELGVQNLKGTLLAKFRNQYFTAKNDCKLFIPDSFKVKIFFF